MNVSVPKHEDERPYDAEAKSVNVLVMVAKFWSFANTTKSAGTELKMQDESYSSIYIVAVMDLLGQALYFTVMLSVVVRVAIAGLLAMFTLKLLRTES